MLGLLTRSLMCISMMWGESIAKKKLLFGSPFSYSFNLQFFRFEPELMQTNALLFNRSSTAEYFISYKRPKLITDVYKFEVQLIGKLATSMHASGEGHTCYIFRRTSKPGVGATADVGFSGVPCDPLFESAWDICKFGVTCRFVKMKVNRFYAEKPVRSRPKVNYKD